MVKIRVLSFEGCPNAIPALDLDHAVAHHLGVDADIEHTIVTDEEEAMKYRFLGSPSVQVAGLDIESERREDTPMFGCRIYRSDAGTSGLPSRDMIAGALREAASSSA